MTEGCKSPYQDCPIAKFLDLKANSIEEQLDVQIEALSRRLEAQIVSLEHARVLAAETIETRISMIQGRQDGTLVDLRELRESRAELAGKADVNALVSVASHASKAIIMGVIANALAIIGLILKLIGK